MNEIDFNSYEKEIFKYAPYGIRKVVEYGLLLYMP